MAKVPGVSASEFIGSPALYVQQANLERDALYLVRLDQAQYRAASFLDDRILETAQAIGWVPSAPIEAAAQHIRPRALHFIFHAGHVGSTLLSRLLDEVHTVLGLREPLPLRSLAQLHDADQDGARFERMLALFLRIWARGFADTQTVIVKATSSAGRLAPAVMAASPQSRAVYMTLAAEPYITTLLAGARARDDLEGFTHERLERLERILGVKLDAEAPLSLGEGAAVAWLAERFAQSRMTAALSERLLTLDFEDFLGDIEATLARIFTHYALPRDEVSRIAKSPVLTRYSKLPDDHAYSPELRRAVLDQARHDQADEIGRGLKFLQHAGERYAAVAALL